MTTHQLACAPDLSASQAMRLLGIHSRQTFWELVYRTKTQHVRYSDRLIRFPAAAIEALRARYLVKTPADLNRLMDGRRHA